MVSGIGCKQTPSWETQFSAEEVAKKREEFWDTRVEGNLEVWQVLRQALGEEPSQAESIINAAGLKMPGGLIMQVYDSLGQRYCLPPFVINEPLRYGTEKKLEPLKTSEKYLDFIIRSCKREDFKAKVSNYLSVKELKDMYGNLEARLFFNGKELVDSACLGHYNIENGVVVQALISNH